MKYIIFAVLQLLLTLWDVSSNGTITGRSFILILSAMIVYTLIDAINIIKDYGEEDEDYDD